MIQLLTDVLQVSTISPRNDAGLSSPCWVIQQQSSHDEDLALSYASAVDATEQHVEALRMALSLFPRNQKETTIVYLCSNSLDFALSILAASKVATCDHTTSSNDLKRKLSAPALLNTRWVVSEMVAALQPAENILLVYGVNWKERARKLTAKLLQKRRESRLSSAHVHSIPLPTFGSQLLEPLSNFRTILQSAQQSSLDTLSDLSLLQLSSSCSSNDAVLVFTSGTTSTAKGVCLSHRALLVQAAAKVAAPCGYCFQTRILATTVPFFHVGGLSSLLAVWMAGGALVEPSPESTRNGSVGFDPLSVWQSLSHNSWGSNTLVVVPAMVHALQQCQGPRQSYMHVDLVLVGGQSLSERQRTFLRQSFPSARIVQTFACTEAASSLTFLDVTKEDDLPLQSPDAPPGVCVGTAPSHIQIQLFPEERTRNTPIPFKPFQPGLIGTRGSHVMNGYWKQPKRSPNEWYVTSDIGYYDSAGRLYFCGRQTDTIRTGGETVWATEVEQVLQRHDLIDEVAVLGVNDDRFGETVACAIVLKESASSESARDDVTLTKLRQWCTAQGLASFKHPRRLVIVSSLPRNSSGKILKHHLKNRFDIVPPSSRL